MDPCSSYFTLGDLGREPTVYLVPERQSGEEFADCLREIFTVAVALEVAQVVAELAPLADSRKVVRTVSWSCLALHRPRLLPVCSRASSSRMS